MYVMQFGQRILKLMIGATLTNQLNVKNAGMVLVLPGRHKMDYEFMLQVIEDGSVTYSMRYNNAVDAVNAYNKFVDHGTCRLWREIVLLEPNGKAHAKVFNYPLVGVN
jgi:hypothetical protein